MAFTISYLGLSCFRIQTKVENEEIMILTDPFDPGKTGLKLPRNLAANVVTVSHKAPAHGAISEVSGKPMVIDIPGEYETRGIFITGFGDQGQNIMFAFTIEGIKLVHLGDLNHMPTDDQIEKLGNVDVLLVPVGNKNALGAKDAEELVTEIEPRIVIPMHYRLPGLKEDLDPVEKFIKELGIAKEEMDKIKITKKDLPEETTRLVVLTI